MMSQLSKKELMGAQKTPQETWAKKDLSRQRIHHRDRLTRIFHRRDQRTP
jgi:hypothetical protein